MKRSKEDQKSVPSRHEDLTYCETEVQKLRAEAVSIRESFQKYEVEVGQAIREILVEAGVFEEVNKLEEDRQTARQRFQQKLKGLNEQATDLQKIRDFLLGREQEQPGPEPDLKPVLLPEPDEDEEKAEVPLEDIPPELDLDSDSEDVKTEPAKPPRSRPRPPL